MSNEMGDERDGSKSCFFFNTEGCTVFLVLVFVVSVCAAGRSLRGRWVPTVSVSISCCFCLSVSLFLFFFHFDDGRSRMLKSTNKAQQVFGLQKS